MATTRKPSKSRKPVANTAAIAAAVSDLYEDAIGLDYAAIDAALDRLTAGLSKAEAIAVARGFDISKSLPTRKLAIDEIRRKIHDRLASFERCQF